MTTKAEYQIYLKSAAWKEKRVLVLNRDDNRCVKCNSLDALVVHHTKYPEILGTEQLEDMQTLCCDCHNVLHGGNPRKHKGNKALKEANRNRRMRIKHNPLFAKTVRRSSPVKIYSQAEIAEYAKLKSV